MKVIAKLIIIFLTIMQLSGCTVLSVVDAVASAAIGVATIGVKGTTAVVGAVIPDGDDDDDD